MAGCNSFGSCVGDSPVTPPPFANSTDIISSTAIFAINATLYVLNAVLFVWLIYNLSKGIYMYIKEDNQESIAYGSKLFLQSLFAGLGIIVLQNVNWIGAFALRVLGVADSANVFLHINLVGLR